MPVKPKIQNSEQESSNSKSHFEDKKGHHSVELTTTYLLVESICNLETESGFYQVFPVDSISIAVKAGNPPKFCINAAGSSKCIVSLALSDEDIKEWEALVNKFNGIKTAQELAAIRKNTRK